MIYDQNFKITTDDGNNHTCIILKNNTIRVVSMFSDDDFEILLVDDFEPNIVPQAIFGYYGIDIKDSIIWKQVSSDIAEYFIKYYPDEILIFNSEVMSVKYLLYSEGCPDELLTTITLIGN